MRNKHDLTSVKEYLNYFYREEGDCVAEHYFVFKTLKEGLSFLTNFSVSLAEDKTFETFLNNLAEHDRFHLRFDADDLAVGVLVPAFADREKSVDFGWRFIDALNKGINKVRCELGIKTEPKSVNVTCTYLVDSPKSVLEGVA